VPAALAALVLSGRAGAVVTVYGPDDGSVFFELDRPTGQLDETGLSGFKILIPSRTGSFRPNDHHLVAGEATEEAPAGGAGVGAVIDLSGTAFDFSIQHNLAGGRNFTFRVTHPTTPAESVLCWGLGCAPGSPGVGRLDGIRPIDDYNGIQIQVRAQDVAGASAALTIAS